MTTPIQRDRTGTSPAGTQKDGCCGGTARAEQERAGSFQPAFPYELLWGAGVVLVLL